MNRRILVPLLSVFSLLVLMVPLSAAQESHSPTPTALPGRGPREIAEGVVWEPILSTPRSPNDEVDVTVGLSRYTLQPGAVLDLVALLGYGFAGPVEFYVEHGVMTLTAKRDNPFVYMNNHAPDLRVPSEGDVDVPVLASVYVPNGEIGPVRNNGDEPLVILVIAIVPDSVYESGPSDYGEESISVVATPSP